MILGQRIINAILRPLIALFLPYRVEGVENLPSEGPVLVLMNHVNLVDVVLPGMFLPRDVVMLAKVDLFRAPVLGLFVRAYGAVPVRRGEADLQAMRLSLEVLRRGQVLVIAPEGTRSEHGRLQRGREGAALVAALTEVPVVPFVQYGHENYLARLKGLRKTPLYVRVGKPFRFLLRGHRRRDELRAMTDEAMYRLAELLPPEYRGVYGDVEAYTYRYTEPWPLQSRVEVQCQTAG